MKNIYGLTIEELEEYFVSKGGKKFISRQVFEWLYQKKVVSFKEMTNIKKELLSQLAKDFSLDELKILKVERDLEVHKYLFELSDSQRIESVLMKHDYGMSLCISSQVGCNMGCRFCESGRLKKIRDLSAAEMVLQILQVEKDIQTRISHVVIMGIGEPFDNYEQVVKFIKIINHAKGLALGIRHITVSTCGLIPKIRQFSELDMQVNLAISLHAPNNLLRDQIMPINKVYPLEKLIEEIRSYVQKTNRRVTFEYIMLQDVNDTPACAEELCDLLKGLNCYINLIPYNETNNLEYKRSKKPRILKFYDIIKNRGINVTIRREFGTKISAACGQLRSKKEEL